MNNEIFDRMIKEGLSKTQVAPSSGLKKAIGRKLFFQNLMVFHKAKIVVAALLIGTTGVLSYNYLNGNDKNMLPSESISQSEDAILNDNVIIEKQKSNNAISDESAVQTNSNENNTNYQELVVPPSNLTDGGNETLDKDQLANNNVANSKTKNLKNGTGDGSTKQTDKNNQKNLKKSGGVKSNGSNNQSMIENTTDLVEVSSSTIYRDVELANLGLYRAVAKPIDLGDFELQTPISVKEENISFKKKHIIRREFSVDAYKHLFNDHDIDNVLLSKEHQEFHWDFYKENNALRTQSLGGLDLNYAVGTKTIKGKVSIGVNLTKVIEEKTRYEFDEVTDPLWLEFFNVDELSWINTFGEDTCIQCFSAHNTEELQAELKKDHNEYSYVNIPVKLGAELNLKYVTFDVMAGMQLSHLTSSTGLYVKEKVPSDHRLYYWDNLEMSTLSKGNEMLKKNHFSWIGSANVRVRITRQFDLLAGYNMAMSRGNITNDGYLLEKSMKYSQAKIGITFYPNRLPLLKK